MQSSSREKKNAARGRSAWGSVRGNAIVHLVWCAVVLSGCGGEVGPDKTEREKAKSFDQAIADARCLSCHLPGNKVGAPSWKEVAKKYKKDKKDVAESYLANKIAHGGSGVWGRVNMPPHAELSQEELAVMARGILAAGKK
ncbi:MAG TPA: hypothetical protein VFW59_10920 [Gallionella sp.]|nr:hypothetical protein [Gallionella sp.]